jgi:hypothetical protein
MEFKEVVVFASWIITALWLLWYAAAEKTHRR